jgi:hypothetical protein
MTYADLLRQRIIRRHQFGLSELRVRVEEMLVLVDRHLEDARATGISLDAHYVFGYAAARVAAEIMMNCEGFRPGHTMGNHAAVFEFLRHLDGGRWLADADYFDHARQTRNVIEYERPNVATQEEVDEIAGRAAQFLAEVRDWLRHNHPDLLPVPPSPPEHP